MPAYRVILRQRKILDARAGPGLLDDQVREIGDREFTRIAQVDRTGDLRLGTHHLQQALNEVVDVAERPRLLALTVDRQRQFLQRADNEVGHHPSVMRMHPGTVGVEQSNHLDLEAMLSVIVEEQSFGGPLALVVARPGPDRVHVSPIVLRLRMHQWIPVHLRGRRQQDLGTGPLGQAQHVDRSVHGSLGGLHRVTLIMNRARWAGKVIDLVNLDVQGDRDIVANGLKARIVKKVRDVVLGGRVIIVDAQHVETVIE